jgi:hypothetical protein
MRFAYRAMNDGYIEGGGLSKEGQYASFVEYAIVEYAFWREMHPNISIQEISVDQYIRDADGSDKEQMWSAGAPAEEKHDRQA